jgi:hypothetical protein
VPGSIHEVCNTFKIVVTGGGGETDAGGGIVMLFAFSALIMVNSCVISLFVDLVASASILWSQSVSIAIVSINFDKFGRRTEGIEGCCIPLLSQH